MTLSEIKKSVGINIILKNGPSLCLICPAGKYSSSDGLNCNLCPAGTYGYGQDTRSSCKSCPSGKYSNSGWGECCNSGEYSREGCQSRTPGRHKIHYWLKNYFRTEWSASEGCHEVLIRETTVDEFPRRASDCMNACGGCEDWGLR